MINLNNKYHLKYYSKIIFIATEEISILIY